MLNILKGIFVNNKFKASICFVMALFITLSLLSYDSNDPGFNIATDAIPNNIFGYVGASLGSFLLQSFGVSTFLLPMFLIIWSWLYYSRGRVKWLKLRSCAMFIVMLSCSYFFANVNELDLQYKGITGVIIFNYIKNYSDDAVIKLGFTIIFIASFILALGYQWLDYVKLYGYIKVKYLNCVRNIIYFISVYNFKWFKYKQISKDTNEYVDIEPNVSSQGSDFYLNQVQAAKTPNISSLCNNKILAATKNINFDSSNVSDFLLPTSDLLDTSKDQTVVQESEFQLLKNSEKLLKILNDFGVRGQVFNINQGPVVTLYEFEPAAGTKSSRVIGLSDDIARSLSALSTRISVIPGKNVLGIELPNQNRLFFSIRELIETNEYRQSNILLPIILGKDLGGNPKIVDLAKMPHLLVAGTTGSGKSVAINAMIISLLYRFTSNECKFIMIDPKMLELSVYEGIPHLLTPVVTESAKAVIALKWAVKEMENRYRLMSNLGVRNIAGYNSKIQDAISKNQILERTLQTGFDPETGQPIYESLPIALDKLPFIVIIVDEMADLMIVAGKDIESSIQRLAQMARAAGIHIIMATQRPSVDVITGVIKANFPSRVSFKVTSKIDSRTILGEVGAEQLLGMGDLLYVGNGAAITRAHGPFVSDVEVQRVTEFLKSQGEPKYITDVIEASDDNISSAISIDGESSKGDKKERDYYRAIQVIKTDKKVSISYIQRRLNIGYNPAATIIERMEKEGIISPPNHKGNREILIND